MGSNALLVTVLLMTAAPLRASAQPATAAPQVTCDDSKAQFAIGHHYSKWLGRHARRAAHARTVRVLRPGEMHTMDFDDTRLQINVDEHAVVTSVKCG